MDLIHCRSDMFTLHEINIDSIDICRVFGCGKAECINFRISVEYVLHKFALRNVRRRFQQNSFVEISV
mgnify:CR=1 FL=1